MRVTDVPLQGNDTVGRDSTTTVTVLSNKTDNAYITGVVIESRLLKDFNLL